MNAQLVSYPTRISVSEADNIIRSKVRSWGTVQCPIQDSLGRVLREEIVADRDFPPFDRVTMDGIAILYRTFDTGRRSFRVVGTHAAGAPNVRLDDPETCLEVMTGAVLPSGTDCVIRVEDLDLADGVATVKAGVDAVRMQNVHRFGSDYAAGHHLLSADVVIAPQHIAVIASVGRTQVRVAALPRIAVVATGDELVPVDSIPKPYQIRMTNPFAVRAALESRGYGDATIHHISDERSTMIEAFGKILDENDVVIVSGGVSAGKFDLVPEVLAELGVRAAFHKVLQRPGLPLWLGTREPGPVVFALPGNPVSALVSVCRHVLPYLARCTTGTSSRGETAVLAEPYDFETELTLFLPVLLEPDDAGRIRAYPRPVHGSGDFARLTGSNGFLELPAHIARFEAGSVWPLYRWSLQ